MKKLIIDRATWASAGKVEKTCLLDSDGYKCCLGFYCNQIEGISDDIVLGKTNPRDIFDFLEDSILVSGKSYDYNADSHFSNLAMEINDDHFIDNIDREENLKLLFGLHGIELIFEGEYNAYEPPKRGN